ncbi:hypothetical protein FRC09_002295 [Ceratobasidium sp. 395]|nr:hypothetical protein FRC09_002295 [Ceratobasidium sp. 395]
MTPESSALGSKSQQVFLIPELATRVLDFSATQDCARLLQTCRTLYKLAIPYVWKNVNNARRLLLLLDRAVEARTPSSQQTEPLDVFLLGTMYANNAFARFEVYAPYVKSLDVYGNTRRHFKVIGWKVLIARARNQALLPNLHTIIVQTSYDSCGHDHLMWVETFISPSLVNLAITPDKPGLAPNISYDAASAIMKTILPQVPRLRKIELFPDYDPGNDVSHYRESTLLALLSADPFYTYIRGADCLQHLSGSLGWVNEEPLLILGQLPRLETITLFGHDIDNFNLDSNFELPQDFFPSLHGLYLRGLCHHDAASILRLKPMLKGLKSLELHINMDELEPEGHDEWLAEIVFPCLIDAPRTEKLEIYPAADAANRLGPFVIDRPSLMVFSPLPLRVLHLRNLVLGSDALQLNLNDIWPSLIHLEIPGQLVALAGLPKFVAIPRLQHLELQLDLQSEPVAKPYAPGESSLVALVASKGGTMCSNSANIDFVASTLLSVAPRLTSVIWPTPGKSASKDEVRQYERAKILNGRLSSLREINTLRSI